METLNIHTLSSPNLAKEAAEHMLASLNEAHFFSQPSFLLLSGGSCVTVAAELTLMLPAGTDLSQTTVGLADERWVEPGSADSNEQALRDLGVISALEQKGAKFISILHGSSSAQETAEHANDEYAHTFSESSAVALLAGVGEDGHTLGILPHPDSAIFYKTFSNDTLVTYYELTEERSNPFKQRITTTLTAISKIPFIYVYATGENKRKALQHLKDKNETVNNMPVLGLYLSEQPLTVMTDIIL